MIRRKKNNMKITKIWLKNFKACCGVNDMNQAEKIGDVVKICNKLIKLNRLDDAIWLITHYMNKKENLEWSIFACEHVLTILSLPIYNKLLFLIKRCLEKYKDEVSYHVAIPLNDLYAKLYLEILKTNYSTYNIEECIKMTLLDTASSVFYNEYIGQGIKWSIAIYLNDKKSQDEYKIKLIKQGVKIIKKWRKINENAI